MRRMYQVELNPVINEDINSADFTYHRSRNEDNNNPSDTKDYRPTQPVDHVDEPGERCTRLAYRSPGSVDDKTIAGKTPVFCSIHKRHTTSSTTINAPGESSESEKDSDEESPILTATANNGTLKTRNDSTVTKKRKEIRSTGVEDPTTRESGQEQVRNEIVSGEERVRKVARTVRNGAVEKWKSQAVSGKLVQRGQVMADQTDGSKGEDSYETGRRDGANESRREQMDAAFTLLTKNVQRIEIKIMQSIESLGKDKKEIMKDLKTQMKSIEDELKEVKVIARMGDSSRNKVGMPRRTPVVMLFQEDFNTEIIRKVFERSIIKQISNGRDVQQFPAAMSFAVNFLMFAVHPRAGETKDKYKTNTGQCFSTFRRGIILSNLLAAQKNIFNVFDNSNGVVNGKHFRDVKKPE